GRGSSGRRRPRQGPGSGVPSGCGASRSGGSSRRRRPRQGAGRARRPGGASRGVGVRAGGGVPRPRSPGGGAGRAEVTETSLAWADTEGEEGEGWPAHPDVASVTSGRASRAAAGPRRAVRARSGGCGRREGGRSPEGCGAGRGGVSALPAPLVFATVSDQREGGGGFWGCYSLVDVIGAAGKVGRRPARGDEPYEKPSLFPKEGPGPLPSAAPSSRRGYGPGSLNAAAARCCRRRLLVRLLRGAPRPGDTSAPAPPSPSLPAWTSAP